MRIVVQRVSRASVSVDGDVVGSVGRGLCLLVGVEQGDDHTDVAAAVDKLLNLRIFADGAGRMNLSLLDVGGEVLVVSQFTLLGDVKRGRRPGFSRAEDPAAASTLIESMIDSFKSEGVETAGGRFGAKMDVEIHNDGPVTFVIEVSQGTIA